ncbi:hypothetical protein HNP65_000301 [Thermosipho japonicus]|uniref:Uncharacterized protein n=1 Tax=Thermosipho japonicus TaxID=90323 RepID=A0A841GQI2_9BACT|nr:hypothetical protein [Thermosipho japonicus]MBB6061879.1 hypothetical protein [Thermosipho japonicus]
MFVGCTTIEDNRAFGIVVEDNVVKIQFSLTAQPQIVMLVDAATGERVEMIQGANNIYSATLLNLKNEWFIEVWFKNGDHKIYNK